MRRRIRQRDVVVVHFPFAGEQGGKDRPALVVSGEEFHRDRREYVLAAISSRPVRDSFEIPIREWSMAGLLIPGKVRIGKFLTWPAAQPLRRIGRLSATDWQHVFPALLKVFG